MGKYDKIMADIMNGQSDSNIEFQDVRNLLKKLGGNERVKGDHFIYTFVGLPEIINIQPKGNKAKSYQIKQIREILNDHGMGVL